MKFFIFFLMFSAFFSCSLANRTGRVPQSQTLEEHSPVEIDLNWHELFITHDHIRTLFLESRNSTLSSIKNISVRRHTASGNPFPPTWLMDKKEKLEQDRIYLYKFELTLNVELKEDPQPTDPRITCSFHVEIFLNRRGYVRTTRSGLHARDCGNQEFRFGNNLFVSFQQLGIEFGRDPRRVI